MAAKVLKFCEITAENIQKKVLRVFVWALPTLNPAKPSNSLSYDMVFINYDVVYKDYDVSCIFYDVV